jgi:hypothetical protein
MRTISTITFLSLVVAIAGCEKKSASEPESEPASESTPAASQPAASQPDQHASASVKPGSHADWCGEHGVPESQCTRCNPSLSAAFKATGDWCDEHGLPESQCLACNPDLKIERPPAPEEVTP